MPRAGRLGEHWWKLSQGWHHDFVILHDTPGSICLRLEMDIPSKAFFLLTPSHRIPSG